MGDLSLVRSAATSLGDLLLGRLKWLPLGRYGDLSLICRRGLEILFSELLGSEPFGLDFLSGFTLRPYRIHFWSPPEIEGHCSPFSVWNNLKSRLVIFMPTTLITTGRKFFNFF
jgi:hypothetical protein